MRISTFASWLLLSTGPMAFGMPSIAPDAAELALRLDRLNVLANVLYVAAHPDDENTRLLAYLVSERFARTAYLSITRGEGGQNLIGPEQGPPLGLIRTQELLAARRIDRAEQFFTRARDFGYSKSSKETLALWENKVLSDAVWVIRNFKPDVIITRFSPEDGETHGHHTASAILALEAFHAAADPKAFPEQLKHVQPWQAKRILWNRGFFTSKPDVDLSGYLKIETGIYNPLLGKSYGEVAAASRSMHKSQGFGASAYRGPSQEYFQHLAGDKAGRDLFDGIDTTWRRAKADYLTEALRHVRTQFRIENPAGVIPALLDVHRLVSALPSTPWKSQKLRDLSEAVEGCSGLWLEATASDSTFTPGSEVSVTTQAINRSTIPLLLEQIELTGSAAISVGETLALNKPYEQKKKITIPSGAPFSQPYWLREPPTAGTFTVSEQELIGLPENPPVLVAHFKLKFGEQSFTLNRPIEYKWTDPVAGERYRPLEIVPAVSIMPASDVLLLPSFVAKDIRVTLEATVGPVAGKLTPTIPRGWTVEPRSVDFKLGGKGVTRPFDFRVHPPGAKRAAKSPITAELTFEAKSNAGSSSAGLERIEHSQIPIQLMLQPARVKLVRADIKIAKRRIGYISGAGDAVATSLRQVGYIVDLLNNETLRGEKLSRYDAIVTGVRAFNTNPQLVAEHAKLMAYVFNGGTMVVQYNTNNRLARLSADIGPYPFEISQDRVTDENAPISIEKPSDALFRKPNPISKGDFENWVQERGLYFAGKWDPKYQTVLALNDPGESPKKGAVLVARYGKGAFIYTGLAFFRQLPAGVVGAYRLFANMLAYGK